MDQYLPLITGSGGAIIVLAILAYLLATGKLHSDNEFQALVQERDDLKTALETERGVNNELAHAGAVTNQLIGALVDLAGREREHTGRDLTAGDLGL